MSARFFCIHTRVKRRWVAFSPPPPLPHLLPLSNLHEIMPTDFESGLSRILVAVRIRPITQREINNSREKKAVVRKVDEQVGQFSLKDFLFSRHILDFSSSLTAECVIIPFYSHAIRNDRHSSSMMLHYKMFSLYSSMTRGHLG